MTPKTAGAAVIAAGSVWRLRYAAHVEGNTSATRAALRKAAARLDDAIANHFETVYRSEFKERS